MQLQFSTYITSDGVIRGLAAANENMHSSIDTAISLAVDKLVDDLSYQGDTLIVPRGYASKAAVVSAVSTLMKKLLGGDTAAIINRFASFNSNPVLLASKVFSPFSWPTESSALTDYMRKMPTGGARAMRRNAGDAFWRQL